MLKQTQAQFHDILNSMEDGYYEVDIRGNLTAFNDSLCRIYGYSRDELLGMNNRQYMTPETLKRTYAIFNRVFRTGESTRIFDWEFVKKDGGKVDVEISVSLIRDENKAPVGFRGIVRDIGRHKQIQAALQKSRNRLESSVEEGTKVLLETNKRLRQEIRERKQAEKINKALFDISSAVNTARNLDDLFASIHSALGQIMDTTNFFIAMVDMKAHTLNFPYFVDTTDDDFSPITDFDTNTSLTGLVVSRRKPVLMRLGDLQKRAEEKGVWGPTPLIWMGAPLMIDTEVIGVVAVQSYVSSDLYREEDLRIFAVASEQMAVAISRKRADDALRESEKKYRHIFKHAPAGICEIDFERLKLIAVNDILCEYTGYSEQELLAMNPMTLLTENSKNIQIERLEQLYRSKRSTSSVEHDIVRKNGEKLTVILNSDFDYQNGKLKAARIVVHDISRLKKAEAEKINAQKFAEEQKKLALVGRIAGKMAHDFNNILGIIMGNTELLLMDCKDEGAKKTLELIFSQTMRGKNLTKNLVAFARDQEPRQEFFRINEKIDLVLRLLKKDLEGIEVMVENEPDLPDLLADPGMIEHALVNLIQNSIHAVGMAEHPMISIRTSRCDTNICFEIQDNGCGIPREHLDSIYEPSFTLKGGKDVTGSYKKAIRGTGYGMSNVKKYIEQHRGNISLESTFGSGTRFTIHLPVVQKELTPLEKTKLQTEKTHVNRNILLVEDEQDISGVQQRILTQPPCSHRVDLAQTGQAAVDLFGKNRYDLVSLDYALPGKMNGMDVYHHIRSIDPSIPILFISGNIEFLESIKELKQQDPHIDHLSKPCRNIAYINRIDQLLEKTSS